MIRWFACRLTVGRPSLGLLPWSARCCMVTRAKQPVHTVVRPSGVRPGRRGRRRRHVARSGGGQPFASTTARRRSRGCRAAQARVPASRPRSISKIQVCQELMILVVRSWGGEGVRLAEAGAEAGAAGDGSEGARRGAAGCRGRFRVQGGAAGGAVWVARAGCWGWIGPGVWVVEGSRGAGSR